MFDGPWGGFIGLFVFAFLCYVALLHEKANTPPPEPYVDWKEKERLRKQEEKELKTRLKKEIIKEYKQKTKSKKIKKRVS
jgi:hypothetical protein|tara:strand:- start:194 stop:433 length:240 start_codon:yes stop_codon:yes gene_type:complete